MNNIINPPQQVITGANASQQATLATDLNQVDDNQFINIEGGVNYSHQGKNFNSTYSSSSIIEDFPSTISPDRKTIVFQIITTKLTSLEDFTLNIPFRWYFNLPAGSKPRVISDWNSPWSTKDWINLRTPKLPILNLFEKISLKVGQNNLDIMSTNSRQNKSTDYGAMKGNLFNKNFKRYIDDKNRYLRCGLPFAITYNNSTEVTRQFTDPSRKILLDMWNDELNNLYAMAIKQYDQGNNLQNSGGFDKIYVDTQWQIPLWYLHEFFDLPNWYPIGIPFRIELSMNINEIPVAIGDDLTGKQNRYVSCQYFEYSNNQVKMSHLARDVRTEYVEKLNTEIVSQPVVFLLNRVEYVDVEHIGNQRYKGQIITSDQLPRRLYIELLYKSTDPLKLKIFNTENKAINNYIVNEVNNPLGGFSVTYCKIIQTNGANYEFKNDYPILQNFFGFENNSEYIERKYHRELQEKATIFEVPYTTSNIGDFTTSFCYIINMDPTYDASLGNTTLLNGQTNASIEIGLNCIDSSFSDWTNILVRVYKLTDYQISLSANGASTVVQFPASIGANQTPIIPAQVNQPQV